MKSFTFIVLLNIISAIGLNPTIPYTNCSCEKVDEMQDNEIPCIEGTYTTIYNNKTVTIEIVDARFNSFFSLKGTLSGYIKYNGRTYPAKGTLQMSLRDNDYRIQFSMTEYDNKNKIRFDFYGTIKCSRTIHKNCLLITPGLYAPNQYDVELKKIK